MKKNIFIIALCLLCVASFAQTKKKKGSKKPVRRTVAAAKPATAHVADTTVKKVVMAGPVLLKPMDRPMDGYFKKTNITHAKVTPYATLRESDVAFQKRVWREIDVREKMNAFMASPKARLIDIIMDAVEAGELTAYDATQTKADPGGDEFTAVLTPAQAKAKMSDSSAVAIIDKNTGETTGSVMRAGEFNADSIVRFRIKEDWYFDRQRSVFEPRIIGIAPLIRPKAGNVYLDYQPAFWIHFDSARPIFAVKEAVNRNNDNTGLSYDDIFMKRLFASYITKQANDKDERIKDYAVGIDRLYESERIKKALRDYELNLWQY